MAINLSSLIHYQDASWLFSKKSSTSNTSQNVLAQVQAATDKNFNVNISTEGLAAFQSQDNAANVDTGIFASKELSPKAQAYLDKLREQYGDYDFMVADNVDDPQALAAGSTKNYSVILSSDELEKMASDDEYANSILGKLDETVKTLDDIAASAQLSGNAQITQLAASFDSNGNTQFSATLEKLSESQNQRLEAAKEQRAAENDTPAVTLQANDSESILEQLRNFNWERFLAE